MNEINRINIKYKAKLDEAYDNAPHQSLEMDSAFQKYYLEIIKPIYFEWESAILHQQAEASLNNAFLH